MTPLPPHPLRPYDPLLINLAPTGMLPRTARVPHVPVTEAAVVETCVRCFELGVSIVHLHARRPDEGHEWRRAPYERMIPEIRARCPGVVVCVTASGRGGQTVEQRTDVLGLTGDAKPDMASLTLGSLNFRDGASVTDPETIRRLASAMGDAGIKPELEIFHSGMAELAGTLLERGDLAPPLYANVLLGAPGNAPARAEELVHVVGTLPRGTVWAAAGIGVFQLPITAMATFMGGHVRTGLEDNAHLDSAGTPATNEDLVRRAADLAVLAQRPLATPAWTRAALGLQCIDGSDGR